MRAEPPRRGSEGRDMLSQRLPEARGPGHQAGHSSDFINGLSFAGSCVCAWVPRPPHPDRALMCKTRVTDGETEAQGACPGSHGHNAADPTRAALWLTTLLVAGRVPHCGPSEPALRGGGEPLSGGGVEGPQENVLLLRAAPHSLRGGAAVARLPPASAGAHESHWCGEEAVCLDGSFPPTTEML